MCDRIIGDNNINIPSYCDAFMRNHHNKIVYFFL